VPSLLQCGVARQPPQAGSRGSRQLAAQPAAPQQQQQPAGRPNITEEPILAPPPPLCGCLFFYSYFGGWALYTAYRRFAPVGYDCTFHNRKRHIQQRSERRVQGRRTFFGVGRTLGSPLLQRPPCLAQGSTL
jgi:hypothetical protein